MTQPYVIWICPVCREQTDDDPEYGRGCYHAEYGGDVDPVEVEVRPVELDATLTTPEVLERLAAQKRRHETRGAMWDWWRSQPKEWRDEQEAERRAKLSPLARAAEDSIREQVGEMRRLLRAKPWLDSRLVPTQPTTKEGDECQ